MYKCEICHREVYNSNYYILVDSNMVWVCEECFIESEEEERNKMKTTATVKTMNQIFDEMVIPIPGKPDTAQLIMETCESIAAMLTDKNEKYGDSALNPINVFSKSPPGESLVARIDDKLARIKNNDDLLRDDIMDITGYLVLLMIEKGWTGYNKEEKL